MNSKQTIIDWPINVFKHFDFNILWLRPASNAYPIWWILDFKSLGFFKGNFFNTISFFIHDSKSKCWVVQTIKRRMDVLDHIWLFYVERTYIVLIYASIWQLFFKFCCVLAMIKFTLRQKNVTYKNASGSITNFVNISNVHVKFLGKCNHIQMFITISRINGIPFAHDSLHEFVRFIILHYTSMV